MPKLEQLLDKLQDKINEFDNTELSTVENNMKLWKKSKKLVGKCDKKIKEYEDILNSEMKDILNDEKEISISTIINRINEINEQINSSDNIDDIMVLYQELLKLNNICKSKILSKIVEQNDNINYL